MHNLLMNNPILIFIIPALIVWFIKAGIDYFSWIKLKSLEKKDDVLKEKIETLETTIETKQEELKQVVSIEETKTEKEAEDFWNKR